MEIAQVGIMLLDIYDEMLKKLMRRTMRGEIYWKLSSPGDMFTVNFQKFSLSMARGQDCIQFIITDAHNKVIDEFRVSNTEKEWDKIAAFYNQIRIKSPDINNAIRAILEELDMEGVVGLQDDSAGSGLNKKIYKIAG
jgi:hypothetical protein